MNRLHSLGLLPCLAWALAGCSSAAQGPATEEVREPIILGTITPNQLGIVEVHAGALSCSGTLLSDRWVLTAQHCINGGANIQAGQTGTLAGSASVSMVSTCCASVSQSGMFLHPTLDVALLYLSGSYVNPATGQPYSNPLYLGTASGLVGQTVLCTGFGDNAGNVTTGTGYGTLRSANLQISQMDGADFRIVPNSTGQIIAHGDSGSSCFVYTGGAYNVIGVASTVGGTSSIAFGDEVAIENFRDWAQGIMGNAVAVFSGNGFTGSTQQLLPGGPLASPLGQPVLFDNYNLAQLTIGNDNVRSWMVPGSPGFMSGDNPETWFATLYAASGFQGAEINSGLQAGVQFSVTGVAMQSGLPATTSSASVAGSANLFGGANFTNLLYEAPVGGVITIPVDQSVNSLTVPAGWTVSLFNSASPGSLTDTFTEGTYSSIGAPFNLLAAGSTVTIREPAALYVDANFGNKVSKLLPGCYDTPTLGVPGRSVSAVFVPAGLSVQLFKGAGFSGANELLTASQSNVGSAWNDATLSACVYASPIGCGVLRPGQALLPGQGVASCDGRFWFVMQTDGNLVLYSGPTPLWATSTNGLGGQIAAMRNDGNFVLYDSNFHPLVGGVYGPGQVTTYAPAGTTPSNTAGNPGASLVVQNDGNVVVYASAAAGSGALWATNTCCH